MARNNMRSSSNSGEMSVREAGQKGGRRTAETHGHDFYQEIGSRGGQKVRQLIEAGKRNSNSSNR